MKKCLLVLVTLLVMAMVLPTAVHAESEDRSVKLTVPEKRVPLDKPIEITVTFTGLDETLEKISISAPRFKITDSKGNPHSTRLIIQASDLPSEAFEGVYEETFTLTWVEIDLEEYSAGDIMHALGPIDVSLIGEGYGRIEMNADGSYVLDNPYYDSYWFSANGKYIAFSAESQEDAAKKLKTDPVPWIIGACAVVLVLATGVICVVLHAKHTRKIKNNNNNCVRFPFHDLPNTVTITCAHVIENQEPILYAAHDEDGMWQFLCGRSHEMSEASVVSLEEIYLLDPSIAQLAEMPLGFCAQREGKDSQWIIRKQ